MAKECWINSCSNLSWTMDSSNPKTRRSYKVWFRQTSNRFLGNNNSRVSKSKIRLKSKFSLRLKIVEFKWSFKVEAVVFHFKSMSLSRTSRMLNILLLSLDKACSKLPILQLGEMSPKEILEAIMVAWWMVVWVKTTDSDRELQMKITIMDSNHQIISHSRPIKESNSK